MSRSLQFRVVGLFWIVGSLFSCAASGVVARVFVSVNGDDANDCSNVATPCRSFGGAITQVDPGGEVIVLRPGGYAGVTITKSVTISCTPGVVAFTSETLTINAPGANVVLRGLTIDGAQQTAGYGIDVQAVGTLHVERCVVAGFSSSGIGVSAAGSRLFLKDTVCRHNGDDGLLAFDGDISVDHCRFEDNNLIGVNVDGARVTVRDSVSSGNLYDGFAVGSSGVENSVLEAHHCVSTNNGRDGFFTIRFGAGTVLARVADSVFSDNAGIGFDSTAGVVFQTRGNNTVQGNAGGDVAGVVTAIPGR